MKRCDFGVLPANAENAERCEFRVAAFAERCEFGVSKTGVDTNSESATMRSVAKLKLGVSNSVSRTWNKFGEFVL